MIKRHKLPSLEAALLIIIIVISLVSLGLYTGPEVAGMATADANTYEIDTTTGEVTVYDENGEVDQYNSNQYTRMYSNSGDLESFENELKNAGYNKKTTQSTEADQDAGTDDQPAIAVQDSTTSSPPPPEAQENTDDSNPPPPPDPEEYTIQTWSEKDKKWIDAETAPPPNSKISYIKTAKSTGEQILVHGGKQYSLQNGDWTEITNSPTSTPKTFIVTSSTGTEYTIKDVTDKTAAEKKAVEDYGITVSSTSEAAKPEPDGKERYHVLFNDGSYEEIYADSPEDAQTKAENIVGNSNKQLAYPSLEDSVIEPEYKITLNGISTTVNAQNEKEAITEYQKKYPNINTDSARVTEVQPGIETEKAEDPGYTSFEVTYTKGGETIKTTVEAVDEESAKEWAEAAGLTNVNVEEQEYIVSYTSNGETITETVKSSELNQFTSYLKEAQLKYTVSKERDADVCIDCETYLITRTDGSTFEKKFSSLFQANQYISSSENPLIDSSVAAKRVYSEEELRRLNLQKTEYIADTGLELYLNTKTNTYQFGLSEGTDTFLDFTGTMSKTETIGDEEDTNNVLIRNWFEVKDGKKESSVASISIVDKEDPNNMEKDFSIDRDTLSLIKQTIGAKGSIKPTKTTTDSTITFTNKDGQVTTSITFTAASGMENYVIEGNKLTGIKTQTDYEYSLDTNQDGEISKEEREADPSEHLQMTKRFTAMEEHDGMISATWYADNFRYGNDNIYFADMYMQEYTQDSEGRAIPGELTYYYIEGGKKGEDGATQLDIWMENGEFKIGDGQGTIVKVVDGEARIVIHQAGDSLEDDIVERAKKRAAQSNSRRWFADFEFRLTQFKGLSGWSQLIFSDDELAEWREGLDKLFSSAYLGTEYWVSEICSSYIPKQKSGTFMMQTSDGLFDVVAHVEGEKTLTEGPENRFLYKLTFSVRNPEGSMYEKLEFNVFLYGDQTVQLYSQDIGVSDGDSFTRGQGQRINGELQYTDTNGAPIVQYSTFNYDMVCIRFNQGIRDARGKERREVCNSIVPYQGPITRYAATAQATGTSQSSPTNPYQEAQI